MPVHNNDIANVFDEIADFLEIEGENPFRIRAYRNAAGTVRGLGTELKDMVAGNADLTEPGNGHGQSPHQAARAHSQDGHRNFKAAQSWPQAGAGFVP
jgi:hypothetical protein